MAHTIAAAHAAPEDRIVRFDGWRSVPEHLKTVAQWKRQGRSVRAACKKTPAAVVDWNGIEVKLFAEDQTSPYNPRPETVAFREDCQAFTAFLNPRRDRHAFKPRRDWELKDWPQTTDYLTDDTLERAFSHREGLAFLPAAAGGFRYYVPDIDFHRPAGNPERFLAQSRRYTTGWSRRATTSSWRAGRGTSRACTSGSSARRNCRWPSCWRRRTASRPG